MDILLPLHKEWSDKILSGEKPFEFRNINFKNLNCGDKIFIYETGYNGIKKVVGEATVKQILDLKSMNSRLACIPFLLYFVKNIKEFESEEERNMLINNIQYMYDNDIEGYRKEIMIKHLYLREELIALKKDPNTCFITFSNKKEDIEDFEIKRNLRFKSQLLCEKCDAWLDSIGYFYNNKDWKYAIQLIDHVKYDIPMDISEFKNVNSIAITTVPQGFCYVCNTK